MPHQHAECIENCRTCHEVCLQTIQHCLEKGGKHADPDHIRLLQDCLQICQTSMDFMLRSSNHHGETCRVCSVICKACADDCAKMEDDKAMTKCAEACQTCADSCHQMAMEHGLVS